MNLLDRLEHLEGRMLDTCSNLHAVKGLMGIAEIPEKSNVQESPTIDARLARIEEMAIYANKSVIEIGEMVGSIPAAQAVAAEVGVRNGPVQTRASNGQFGKKR